VVARAAARVHGQGAGGATSRRPTRARLELRDLQPAAPWEDEFRWSPYDVRPPLAAHRSARLQRGLDTNHDRPACNADGVDLPADPFLPEDPRLRDAPVAQYMLEAAQLTRAFADVPSLSSLVDWLHRADPRDVELVAMLAVTTHVHDALDEASRAEGLTTEEANERFLAWLSAPEDDGSREDYRGGLTASA
jgi:hypothetical protein